MISYLWHLIYYFQIQYRRLYRWFLQQGIHPALGLIFGMLIFFAMSAMLFFKTSYAPWIYGGIASYYAYAYSQNQNRHALKVLFSRIQEYTARSIELIISSLLYCIYLLWEGHVYFALGIIFICLILPLLPPSKLFNRAIPTPFYKKPFEFIVGFRKIWFVYLALYFILFKSLQVDNFYLGLFGLTSIFLASFSFYMQSENTYFMSIYNCTPKVYIRKKLKTALTHIFMLSIPYALILSIVFYSNILYILAVVVLGLVNLSLVVLAKYSNFPKEQSIVQAILILFSIIFPPFLLFTVPLFYKQSLRSIAIYLP